MCQATVDAVREYVFVIIQSVVQQRDACCRPWERDGWVDLSRGTPETRPEEEEKLRVDGKKSKGNVDAL